MGLPALPIQGDSSIEVRNTAIDEGMITLRRAAILNAMRGHTSIEEFLRVTLSDQRAVYTQGQEPDETE